MQLAPLTHGYYVNVASSEQQADAAHGAYGDNYPRLAALKKRYDPNNLFRLNANIKPAACGACAAARLAMRLTLRRHEGAMQPMHLVDATLFYSPTSGGVKRYLSAKHAWLAAHTSWEHTIVVPGRETRLARGGVCTLSGYPVPGTFNYRLPLSPRRWLRLLDELEPTLIEAGDAFHPAWCGWRVAQRRGIPLVAFYHCNLPGLFARRVAGALTGPLMARYVRMLYERCDAVFAPSRVMCDYLSELGVPRVAHQPLGVDTEVFHPARRRGALRTCLGLDAAARVLIFAGRFAEEKNLPLLFAAFERLGSPYHLLLIGGGRTARPAANVTMLPYRRDSLELAEWIASSDALVHAGTRETFGLVILEAMACGRPVVAARAGAFPELLDESVGVLAEPGSAAGMAEAIAALYERDLEAVGAAARAHVLRRFTWHRAFHAQLSAYASLVGAERTPLSAGEILEARSPSS